MSPGNGFSFFAPGGFGGGASCFAASGDCATTIGAPTTPAVAAAVFKKARRSRPGFFSSDILFLFALALAIDRPKSLTSRIAYRTQFRIQEQLSMSRNP